MKKIFDINNPFWAFVSRICDAFVLHLCWVICCIPIVTFGPATTALYYAMMKDVADEETHYVRAFFRSFKENLKQGIVLGLIYIVVAILLIFSYNFYEANIDQGEFFVVARILAIAVLIIYMFSFIYVFPLQSRFINPIRQTIKNSFLLSIKHIGWTLLMVIVQLAPIIVFVVFSFLPIIFIGEGLVALINSYMLNHILKPYIDKELEKQGVSVNDPDHWEVPEEVTEEAAGVWPPVSGIAQNGESENPSFNQESREEVLDENDSTGKSESDAEGETEEETSNS